MPKIKANENCIWNPGLSSSSDFLIRLQGKRAGIALGLQNKLWELFGGLLANQGKISLKTDFLKV